MFKSALDHARREWKACFGTSLPRVLSSQAKIRSVWVYLLLDKELQGALTCEHPFFGIWSFPCFSCTTREERASSTPLPRCLPVSCALAGEQENTRAGGRKSRREFEFLPLEDFGVVDVEKVAVEGSLDDPGNDGDQVDLVLGKVPAVRSV
jgi:hypothetical protein